MNAVTSPRMMRPGWLAAFYLLAVSLIFVLLLGCGGSGNGSARGSSTDADDDVQPPADDDSHQSDDDLDDDSVDDDASDDDADDDLDDDASDDDADDDTVDCIEPYPGMTLQTGDAVLLCPGTYEIPAGATPAITVAGDHVTLSAEGVTLVGDGTDFSDGLRIDDAVDLLVEGLALTNYGYGVDGSGDTITLRGLTITDSRQNHVQLGGQGVVIENGSFHDSYNTGVVLQDCTSCTIHNCHSENTRANVIESNFAIIDGGYNTIEGCSVYTRNELGCNAYWISGSDNIIRDNQSDTGYKDASHLFDGASRNLFVGNTFHLAQSWQFSVVIPPTALNNEFYGNTFYVGILDDQAPNSDFCDETNDLGNTYLDGAIYQGPDVNGGTCPVRFAF